MPNLFSSFFRAPAAGALLLCVLTLFAIPAHAQTNAQRGVPQGAPATGQALSAPDLSGLLGAQGGLPGRGSADFNNIMRQLQGQGSIGAGDGADGGTGLGAGGGMTGSGVPSGLMDGLQSMATTMALQNAQGAPNALTFGDICSSFLLQILSGQDTAGQPQALNDQDIAYLRSICAQNAQQRVQSAPK